VINDPPICSIDNPPGNVEIQTGDNVSYSGTAIDNDGTIASYAWSFVGGSPISAIVEDPGLVNYDESGVYLTTFSAEDNAGATCPAASITVTVLEPDTFTVGGNVSGLDGNGLVLQNNTEDDLAIGSDGNFMFAATLENGETYNVTVLTQPTNFSQTCTVTSGSGTLAGANITDVSVTCTTNTFTIGGNVNGLVGTGLMLQNNAGDNLAIGSDGDFTFATALEDGSTYVVTVLTQPTNPGQTCAVTSGSGTLVGANVTDVSVTCSTAPAWCCKTMVMTTCPSTEMAVSHSQRRLMMAQALTSLY